MFLADLNTLIEAQPASPVRVYLNSPGGAFDAAWRIVRALAAARTTVSTYCLGQSCGVAVNILAQGTKGLRFALPQSKIRLVDLWGGRPGAEEERRCATNEVIGHFALVTGRRPAEIQGSLQANRVFTPGEAVAYGLIDRIVTSLEG
jgi:ATP-dependent Clp protease protease subunit